MEPYVVRELIHLSLVVGFCAGVAVSAIFALVRGGGNG